MIFTYPENTEVLLAVRPILLSLSQQWSIKTILTAFIPPKPVVVANTVC